MTSVEFDLETLLTEASEKASLDDFGSEDFRPGLQSLLETYDQNGFTEHARKSLRKRAMNLLVSRLDVEAAWKRHPEALDLSITKPLFLTGLPRTGTSALLNVLANDPAARALKLWEAHNPAPLENLARGEEDPRYLQTKAYYERMNAKSEFKKIHYMTADSAEECIFLLNHTFQDAQYGFEIFLEPYASFYSSVDRQTQYEYHADLLRLLQWQRPADRWLLKAPSHLGHLDIISQQHPDSGMIITHRNPLEVVGSYCSMMSAVIPERTHTDPQELGRRVLDDLVGQVEHSMQAREAIDSGRILDVQYVDFTADSLAVVDHIYAHLDLPYPEGVRNAISAYIDDHPRGKHGSHDYKLAQFGLNEQQVLDCFSNYISAFNIAV